MAMPSPPSSAPSSPPSSPGFAADAVQRLRHEIAACTRCAADLAAGPRPVVQFSATSRILIIGQAPGSRVHASGVPFDDSSGDRLRAWTGLTPTCSTMPAAWP